MKEEKISIIANKALRSWYMTLQPICSLRQRVGAGYTMHCYSAEASNGFATLHSCGTVVDASIRASAVRTRCDVVGASMAASESKEESSRVALLW